MELSKQHRLLVQYSITRMIKKDIMILLGLVEKACWHIIYLSRHFKQSLSVILLYICCSASLSSIFQTISRTPPDHKTKWQTQSHGIKSLESWKTLHDPATLSELAILSLYGEAISYLYIKAIRSTSESGEKQNILDLGPLHQKVSTHIQAIIANPFNFLCENPSSDIASLEEDEWQHPDIFKSIKDLNLSCLE